MVAAGKSGIVLAADRETGKVIWQRAVGKHNGHDDDGLLAMRGEDVEAQEPVTRLPGHARRRDRADVDRRLDRSSSRSSTRRANRLRQRKSGRRRSATAKSSPSTRRPARSSGTKNSPTPPSARRRRSTTSSSPPPTKGSVSAFDAKTGQVVWREKLPAGSNSGVMADGNTLIAPAGLASAAGQTPQIVAYKLE